RPPVRPSSTAIPAARTSPPSGSPSREVRRTKPVPVPQPDWRQAAPQESGGGGGTGLGVGLLLAPLVGARAVFLIVRYGSALFSTDKPGTVPTERKAEEVPSKQGQSPANQTAEQRPPSQLNLALEALDRNDYAGAISLFNEVLQAEPRNARALHK